jgi:hypothetical protein
VCNIFVVVVDVAATIVMVLAAAAVPVWLHNLLMLSRNTRCCRGSWFGWLD